MTPICWNQSPRKSQHHGRPVQTLPPTNNRVPGHGACTPVWEHEGGRHHWLRESGPTHKQSRAWPRGPHTCLGARGSQASLA